jgi:hypothetical protein
MKKSFLFIIVLFTLISCEEDVRFNNPSFQGIKDNVFWRAIVSTASVGANGALVIKAYSGNEVITLKMPMPATVVNQKDKNSYVTYVLGTSTSKVATYVLTDSSGTTTFTTGSGIGDGQIIITDYDKVGNTVSGSFKFNAENIYNNPLVGDILNFQQGVFYKVPIIPSLLAN